jgi:hypothetical protein
MWALPFGYLILAYLPWPNKEPTMISAAQDGPIRRLRRWKDVSGWILDEQGKKTLFKGKID